MKAHKNLTSTRSYRVETTIQLPCWVSSEPITIHVEASSQAQAIAKAEAEIKAGKHTHRIEYPIKIYGTTVIGPNEKPIASYLSQVVDKDPQDT